MGRPIEYDAAIAIWDDLDDRAGIYLDDIDPDIKREIIRTWAKIIAKTMAAPASPDAERRHDEIH